MRLQADTSKISLAYSSLPDPKLQISIKITVAYLLNDKKKLHIYSKTTIGLSSRQCLCNF